MGNWKDKVVLVTGASGGLGRAIAGAFAARGSRLVICARGAEALAETAQEVERRGGDVLAVPTDITCQTQVERLFEQALDRFGQLDVLVNNAGRSMRREVLATSPEDFRELMELNFIAAVRCTRAAAPHVLAAKGHIVNIGSLASKSAGRYVGAYPATKFALAAYTQQLRLELGNQGVHVLLVCPGPIARDEPRVHVASDVEGLPERAKKPGAGIRAKAIDPDWLAEKIIFGCEHRRKELIYPALAGWLFFLMELSPRIADYVVRRMT